MALNQLWAFSNFKSCLLLRNSTVRNATQLSWLKLQMNWTFTQTGQVQMNAFIWASSNWQKSNNSIINFFPISSVLNQHLEFLNYSHATCIHLAATQTFFFWCHGDISMSWTHDVFPHAKWWRPELLALASEQNNPTKKLNATSEFYMEKWTTFAQMVKHWMKRSWVWSPEEVCFSMKNSTTNVSTNDPMIFQQHSNDIPTTFQWHSNNIPTTF